MDDVRPAQIREPQDDERGLSAGEQVHTSASRMHTPALRLIRVLRLVGSAVLAFAVPSAALAWHEDGMVTALLVFAGYVYIGTFAIWGLPWMLRRIRGEGSP
jgi:hypothetical protein